MHRPGRVLFGIFCISITAFARAQQPTASTPQRDSQAIAVLQQSLMAMGRVPPSDSVATGTVTIVAGSTRETGTIRILTRGVDQTSEEIQTSRPLQKIVYSRGVASEIAGTTSRALDMELVVTSQCPDFPLPLIAAAVNDPQSGLQYVGLETVNGSLSHHIRFWSTFANFRSQHLAEFSTKDVWIESSTNLPRRLSFQRREALGPVPRIPLEISYSDYRSVNGVLYPFLIRKALSGTPWTTITIASIALNTGLSDTNFPVK